MTLLEAYNRVLADEALPQEMREFAITRQVQLTHANCTRDLLNLRPCPTNPGTLSLKQMDERV